MICKLDENDYCPRHKCVHKGRAKTLALEASVRGEKYRQLWDKQPGLPVPLIDVKKKIVVAPNKKANSPDISIIHPSLMSRQDIQESVDRINSIDNPRGYKYEIIISTDKPADYAKNVVCLHDTDLTGSIQACNKSLAAARGTWILSFPDGTYPPANMFEILDWIATEYQDKRYKISSFSGGGSPVMLSAFRWFAPFYSALDPPGDGCILRYPCGLRESFSQLGCFFNPSFKHRVGDNWLAIWLTLQGEVARECPHVSVSHKPHRPHRGNDLFDRAVLIRLLRDYPQCQHYGNIVEVKRLKGKPLPL